MSPYRTPFLPQANPSEGGTGGIGADMQGTQFRDWSLPKILARITGHGTNNAYSFTQVQADTTAAGWSNFDGAISGNTTTTAAYEANGRTDVATGTIVEMTPTYGSFNGYTFLMPGGGGHGSVVEAAVHVTSGPTGSPSTYTVKSVARDSGGALVETTPVRTYSGVYEAQNRNALVDPTSTPTHELPLWVDENGKYYFQIDQYTDGSASPALPGQVSTTTQSVKGVKHFINQITWGDSDGGGAIGYGTLNLNDGTPGSNVITFSPTTPASTGYGNIGPATSSSNDGGNYMSGGIYSGYWYYFYPVNYPSYGAALYNLHGTLKETGDEWTYTNNFISAPSVSLRHFSIYNLTNFPPLPENVPCWVIPSAFVYAIRQPTLFDPSAITYGKTASNPNGTGLDFLGGIYIGLTGGAGGGGVGAGQAGGSGAPPIKAGGPILGGGPSLVPGGQDSP